MTYENEFLFYLWLQIPFCIKYLMKQKVIKKPPSLLLWTGVRIPCEKNRKRNSGTEWRILPWWHLTASLSTGIDPSHSFRMTINISLIMTPYRSSHHDTLSFNRHSEWRQECFVRKQESGNMTRSEESMTRMTSLTDSSGHLCPTPFKFMHANRKPRHMKKDTYICKCLFLYQQLPILPGRFRPSTFGVCELNFRVRHGYGWSSQLSPLFLWEPVLSKPYRRSPEVIRLSRCF